MSSNNNTTAWYDRIGLDVDAWNVSHHIIYTLVILIGFVVNSWMLASMVTSPEIRSAMRNRLICFVLAINVFRVIFLTLFDLIRYSLASEHSIFVSCQFVTFTRTMRFTIMWVENWYVLIFMAHYICTQLEFDPIKHLTVRQTQIGTWLILAGPCVLSLIVGPSVLAHNYNRVRGVHSQGCVFLTSSAFKTLYDFGIVAPWFLKLGLLLVILLLHRNRKTRYSSGDSSLIGPNAHIDDVKPYVVLYVIVALTQFLLVVMRLRIIPFRLDMPSVVAWYGSWYLSESRCVIVPIAFLYFEDIRDRIKTWRPWYRPAPGIDLPIRYNETKESDGN